MAYEHAATLMEPCSTLSMEASTPARRSTTRLVLSHVAEHEPSKQLLGQQPDGNVLQEFEDQVAIRYRIPFI